jgi:fibronectin-binding autotransporter adhesin
MKNHKILFAGGFALNLLLSPTGHAQMTNLCDGCTISSAYTNLSGNYYNLIGTNTSLLTGVNTTFFNQGTVQQTGSGSFLVGGYQENSFFNNGPGAIYQFATDNIIGNDFPGYSSPVFTNQGLVWKSGGTNYSGIQIAFNNQGGVIKVDSGTLYLSGGGTSSNGVFNVAAGAVLNLTGGGGPTWSGEITGSGSGSVVLTNGSITANPSLTLDFTNSLFQWDGGTLQGIITNRGIVTLSSTNTSLLTGINTTFFNQGMVQQTGSGRFLVGGYQENSYFNNGPGAAYQFMTDSGIGNDVPGYSSPVFTNDGLVWKSGGTNTSAISIAFNNLGGMVQVDSGTLTLNGGGTSSNGVFNVASGAVLDLTGGNNGPTWSGDITGSGSGQILLDSGTLFARPSLALAFPPGLFQWNGGTLQGIITNTGTVTISGTNVSTLTGANTAFVNLGMVKQTGSGGTLMGTFGGNVYFNNEPGATYQFASDNSVTFGNNFYGQTSASVPFVNQGLVWKSGGTNTSAIGAFFNNQGGVVQVDSGTLTLYGGGTSSNGVFNIASGAVLDLTGGANGPTWSGAIMGSGAGQVWLDSGTLYASPSLVLAFPPGLFQWNGGTLQGIITNTGTVTISGTNVSTLTGANTTFVNEGMVTQTGSGGTLVGAFGANVYFTNEPGATYQFASDSSIAWGLNFYGQGPPPFNNQGLVWKSAGTNTSAIWTTFINNFGGSIEVDSGVLALEGTVYAQNSGNLTIALGGPNANQCGRLAVSGPAALNGPLKVTLTNGYVPVLGDQFEILSCSSLSGTFSSVNIPAGMTVSNLLNNQGQPEYVYLVVTGIVPAQIQSPGKSGDIFKFSFGTANGQSYTVQQNTNLATANWTFYTNITGNGSLYQFTTPVANIPQRFFRVASP